MTKIILILSLIFSLSALGQDDSLAFGMMPKFYKKRTEPVLNIGLVYYGDYYKMEDLERVQQLFEKRFYAANGNALKLNTVVKAVIPFKHQIENYPDYRQEHVTELERLQRLWYYDNVGMNILNEVYQQSKATPEIDMNQLDALVVITGAQFDALGFASGRVAVTENPMEIAWGLPDGGRVELVTDARVVDELIHEVGHTLFLDHATSQCQRPGMTYAEQQACCANSPSKDDVMSYCRQREKVNESFFYGFKDCNRRIINEKIIPAMLSGGKWNVENREKCE
jgi:hypothetical protein